MKSKDPSSNSKHLDKGKPTNKLIVPIKEKLYINII